MKANNINLSEEIFSHLADQILYEDNHILVVNKKPSQIVQGDKSGDIPLTDLYKAFLKQRDHKPGNVYMGLVHRLDRPVSGALLLAKTDKALTRLNAMLRERDFEKTYWAITRIKPPKNQDKLCHFLRKNESQNKSYVCSADVKGALRAELDYRLIGKSDRYYLLEIRLHTGRHHQIRTQLADIGCPIKGDLKYGDKRSNPDASISLHARSLSFMHPVKKEVLSIEAPLPLSDIWPFLSISCL